MKYANAFLMILLIFFRASCFAEEISWGKMAQGVRCSISASNAVLKKGEPSIVTVIIENRTIEAKKFSITAGFNLNRMEYWAPVKLGSVSEHLEAAETFELFLEAGEQKMYQVDLKDLKWGRGLSSAWPYKGLFSTVKSGKYRLSFNIYFGNIDIPNWVRSNEIEVSVVKTNKKTDMASSRFYKYLIDKRYTHFRVKMVKLTRSKSLSIKS